MMLPLFVGLFSFFGGCLPIGGERITVKDFARVIPQFSVLPESVSLGLAPLPGAHRSFTGVDVQRIASQYGIKTEFHDPICFEWPMRRLDRQEVLKAMGEALGRDSVDLEDFSLFPAPPGRIVFPLEALNRRPQGASFWRGYVRYGDDQKFNIWAKVNLHADVAPASRLDVVGGSRVMVLVRSGAAELKLEAQAITSGSKGQTVTIRNPRSGRSFSAEITGKDTVLVEARTAIGETER